MFGAAKDKRDRRYRAKLLLVLHEAARSAPDRCVSGRFLVDAVNGLMPPGQSVEDEREALGLCRDLVTHGLAQEHAAGQRRRGQAFTIDFVKFEITRAGSELHLQQAPPMPLVDDDRQLEGS